MPTPKVFTPKVFENRVFYDVVRVAFIRLGSSNRLAQGSRPSFVCVTTMKAMSQPVGSLCPPPDVALESVCQATLCLSAP